MGQSMKVTAWYLREVGALLLPLLSGLRCWSLPAQSSQSTGPSVLGLRSAALPSFCHIGARLGNVPDTSGHAVSALVQTTSEAAVAK